MITDIQLKKVLEALPPYHRVNEYYEVRVSTLEPTNVMPIETVPPVADRKELHCVFQADHKKRCWSLKSIHHNGEVVYQFGLVAIEKLHSLEITKPSIRSNR